MHPSTIRLTILTTLIVMLAGCAGSKESSKKSPMPIEQADAGKARKKGSNSRVEVLRKVAEGEWELFGRQVVRLDDQGESMPHVGHWEDDGDPWSSRVNGYWRSVGKPSLDGFDCKQPWSAAFITWLMRESGVSSLEFPGSDAHWNYIRYFADPANQTVAAYQPHRINQYSPKTGDLICATRGTHGFIPVYDDQDARTVLMGHAKLHCDLVVEVNGSQLASIGGNVRNSVSKTQLTLDGKGHLRPSEQRPWFVVLENRFGQ